MNLPPLRNLLLGFGSLALLAGAAVLAARRENPVVFRSVGVDPHSPVQMDKALDFAGSPELACDLQAPPPPPPPPSPRHELFRVAKMADPATGPRLIRSAELELEVKDFTDFEARMKELAARHGYLASAEVQVREDGRRRAHLELKAVASRFEAALAAFKALGKVRKESQSVEDATLRWVDLEARAATKRMAIGRLRELLQQRTGKLADVVTAEKALAEMTESLESMEAQRRVLAGQVEYASLQAEVFEPGAKAEPEGLRAKLKGLGQDAMSALLRSLGWMFGGFLLLLPWALLGWVAHRLWKRRPRVVQE